MTTNPLDKYDIDSFGMTPYEYRVYHHLCCVAEECGGPEHLAVIGEARSRKEIARRCGMSVSTVGRVLRTLEDSGLISRQVYLRNEADLIDLNLNLDNFPGMRRV